MNRRTLLSTGGAIGAVALTGCVDTAFSIGESPHLPEPTEEYACLSAAETESGSVFPESLEDTDRETIVERLIQFEQEYLEIVEPNWIDVSVSLENFERKNDRITGLLLRGKLDPQHDDDGRAGEATFEYSAYVASDDGIFRGKLGTSPSSESTAFDVEPETWIKFHC